MNPIPAKSNGHKQHQSRRPEVLSFLDVNRNSYRRNSVNSSWTSRKTTGKDDVAVSLWSDCLTDLQRSKPESLDTDALQVPAIQQVIEQRLQSLPEITDNNEADLDHKQQLLRDLAACKPTKIVQHVRGMVKTAVSDALTPLRAKLHDALSQSPFTCLATIDFLQQALHDVQYPVPDFTPQKRFMHGMRALPVVERATALPAKLRDRLTAELRKQCANEFHAAVATLVTECVVESLRQAAVELSAYLEELRTQQATFRRNVAAVTKQLDEHRALAKQRSAKSRSSVLLEIDTPDEAQLLTGIRDLYRCADHAALVFLFADKLHWTLNEMARQRHPLIRTPASLTELMTKLPVSAVAAGVFDVVVGLLGDLHTAYTAVRSFGVRRAAQELFDRAAPLCSLNSRDHILLNVETHRDLIVRLPQPRGAEDGEIAEQLRDAFRELQMNCQFIEDATEIEISVFRALVAFPIGVESTNASLLHDYAESARQGHRPHLFGILPDSPDGRHLPQLLALAEHTLQS